MFIIRPKPNGDIVATCSTKPQTDFFFNCVSLAITLGTKKEEGGTELLSTDGAGERVI